MPTLTMPATPGFTSSRFGLMSNTQTFESPLTRTVQTLELTGARWRGDYVLPPMKRPEASAWIGGFLIPLMGRAGRFYGFDPDAKTPRGTWAGTPLVNGAAQTGLSLILDGFTASATVKVGDYFTVNGELKMINADGTANGAGALTVSFNPSLRVAPADNAPLTSTNPTCTMMLIDDDQAMWDADNISVFGLRFSGIEVFA